jgi:hypothetical protein
MYDHFIFKHSTVCSIWIEHKKQPKDNILVLKHDAVSLKINICIIVVWTENKYTNIYHKTIWTEIW